MTVQKAADSAGKTGKMIIPVIIAGGSGTRLWPLSRKAYPKQLIAMSSENTLLQDTVLRFSGREGVGEAVVVCGEEHRFMVAEQLQGIGAAARIILEPCGRNTAPAVALAAFAAAGEGDPLLLVMPADHVIGDPNAFWRAAEKGADAAADGRLVTFGIRPSAPETGYGYIKTATTGDEGGPVDAFVEKPDAERARKYVDSGEYLWNSGIFMFRAQAFLDELLRLAPEIHACSRAAFEAGRVDLDFIRVDGGEFARCPDDSIDYAVMEKTDKAWCVPVDCGWNDLGSWNALWETAARDAHGNLVNGNVVAIDLNDCYVRAESRMVAAVGLDGMVVVETPDAVLVVPRDRSQDVKDVVNILKSKGCGEVVLHRRVYRPWGSYETIDRGERFQVKRIVVRPGASLSYQMHHHRAEHWIVVRGTARVTNGNKVITLTENQSTYIPLGEKHRLENPGVIPLEIIEVQSGSYLGEDDIVRFEDVYGREND